MIWNMLASCKNPLFFAHMFWIHRPATIHWASGFFLNLTQTGLKFSHLMAFSRSVLRDPLPCHNEKGLETWHIQNFSVPTCLMQQIEIGFPRFLQRSGFHPTWNFFFFAKSHHTSYEYHVRTVSVLVVGKYLCIKPLGAWCKKTTYAYFAYTFYSHSHKHPKHACIWDSVLPIISTFHFPIRDLKCRTAETIPLANIWTQRAVPQLS